MRMALAILLALAGIMTVALGIAWAAAAVAARRVFERLLASTLADTVKLQASELLDRVTHPLLRLLVNRHTGGMAGERLVTVVREDLAVRLRLGFAIIGGGIALIIIGIYLPFH